MTLSDLATSDILYLHCIMIRFLPFTLGDKTLFRHLRTKKGHKANHTIITKQFVIPLLICWVIEAYVLNIISAILFILLSFPMFYSVCQAGQWQCSTERCAAQCSIIGTMQITTFDKKRYNFQASDCQITAVEVRCNFRCWYNPSYHIFIASSLTFYGMYTAHLSFEMQYQRLG